MMTRGGTPTSRTLTRRTLTGAALLALVAGSAIGQAQADRPGVELPNQNPVGTPTNPAPVFTIPASEPVNDQTLYLAVGRIDTSARKDAGSLAEAIREAAADDRMVVQLDGPMTPERRQRMTAAGLAPMGYLPTNAFIVRPSGADADKAGALDFVVWHHRYAEAWKTAPEVGTQQFATEDRKAIRANDRMVLDLTLFEDADLVETLNTLKGVAPNFSHTLTQRFGEKDVITVIIDEGDTEALTFVPEVQFIEPTPEVQLRNATTTWIVQSNVVNQTPLHDAGLRGEGQIVAVSDGRVREDHCAFNDGVAPGPSHRKIEAYNSPLGSDSHGTHVAGTAVGDNGSAGDLRGIAYNARMVFDDTPSFSDTAMYNMLQTHHNQGARIHTNSWGNDSTTAYDGLPRGIDRFSYDFEESLVLFAVTNTGSLRNPENSKNNLAVGATNAEPGQGNHCTGGDGPTSDGRRKPEIYAPGCGTISASSFSTCGTTSNSGTSMACPAVAGTAALVRQYYTEGFYPNGAANAADALTPSGALIKATLLNSTVDMTGVAGFPSNREGWGRLLADNALFFAGEDRRLIAEDVRNAQGMTTGEVTTYGVEVLSTSEPLNITVVWTEPPATAGASFASINNLDLRVISPSGVEYKGNVFGGGSSVTGGSFDDRNNVETVRVNSPEAGNWSVEVVAAAVNQGTQGFAFVANGDVRNGLIPLGITVGSAIPESIEPGVTLNVQANISLGDDTLAGPVQAFVAEDGVNYVETDLSPVGTNTFGGVIGPFDCGDTPKVYFAAAGVETGDVSPSDASVGNPKEIMVGLEPEYEKETFETNSGWTVTNSAGLTSGAWVRADPQPTAAQPGSDTTPDGTLCFVTDGRSGAGLGSFDVDGGSTRITSPAFDLSGIAGATVEYQRWYSNDAGTNPNSKVFTVEVSDDNGATWNNLETIGPAGPGTSGGWILASYRLEDFVALTDSVRIRFTADDSGAGSVVEAAIDDFRIFDFFCDETPLNSCDADFDGNGVVDLTDFGAFGQEFGRGLPGGGPACDVANPCVADFDGNGVVDLTDFGTFGTEFGRGLPGGGPSCIED